MRSLILVLTTLALSPAMPLRAAEPEHDHPMPASAPAADSTPDVATLHDLMARAVAASDPRDRERLLAEHLASMRRALAALRAEDCGGPMNGMSGGMTMMKCHEAMAKRMTMLIELMDQLLAREDLETARRKR